MISIKHNKFRNTGILFELLIRQITADTMSQKDSKAVNIIKKYFVNTELAKENKLYQSISKSHNLTESKAEVIISTVLEANKSLNKEKLLKEKYNLIKEIKNNFDLDEFFKAKISNYKLFSSTYTLLEANSHPSKNLEIIITSKLNILESITPSNLNIEIIPIISEFEQMDKGTRALVYKLMLEKFNSKYDNLSNSQKRILKEYITQAADTTKLRKFINDQFKILKESLIESNIKIDNPTIKIKINEIINLINPIITSKSLKDDHVIALLQYQELNEEISKLNNE
jgi:hypothetical protein